MIRLAGEQEHYESEESSHSGGGTSYYLNHNKGKYAILSKCYKKEGVKWIEIVDYWNNGGHNGYSIAAAGTDLDTTQIDVYTIPGGSGTIKFKVFF